MEVLEIDEFIEPIVAIPNHLVAVKVPLGHFVAQDLAFFMVDLA